MPGRRPKVSIIRHYNRLQVMQNCFIYNRSVIIVTDCNKAKSICNIGRKVAQFLPDNIGRMLIIYIT